MTWTPWNGSSQCFTAQSSSFAVIVVVVTTTTTMNFGDGAAPASVGGVHECLCRTLGISGLSMSSGGKAVEHMTASFPSAERPSPCLSLQKRPQRIACFFRRTARASQVLVPREASPEPLNRPQCLSRVFLQRHSTHCQIRMMAFQPLQLGFLARRANQHADFGGSSNPASVINLLQASRSKPSSFSGY